MLMHHDTNNDNATSNIDNTRASNSTTNKSQCLDESSNL